MNSRSDIDPAPQEPTTEAGRRLQDLLLVIVPGMDTSYILAIEAEARAEALDVALKEVERLTSWPRVSMFAYDAKVRGEIVNPTEDRVVIDRDAVLAILSEKDR